MPLLHCKDINFDLYLFFYNENGNEDGDEHYNDNNINNFSVGSNTLKL